MSKAAVAAKKEARKREVKAAANERFFAMAEFSSATDASVVTCDSCNLLQVTGGEFRLRQDGAVVFLHGRGCFLCGGEVGLSAAA